MAQLATIHILVDTENSAEACDGISDLLRGAHPFVIDWQYQKVNGDYPGPRQIKMPSKYEEGDLSQWLKSVTHS